MWWDIHDDDIHGETYIKYSDDRGWDIDDDRQEEDDVCHASVIIYQVMLFSQDMLAVHEHDVCHVCVIIYQDMLAIDEHDVQYVMNMMYVMHVLSSIKAHRL